MGNAYVVGLVTVGVLALVVIILLRDRISRVHLSFWKLKADVDAREAKIDPGSTHNLDIEENKLRGSRLTAPANAWLRFRGNKVKKSEIEIRDPPSPGDE